MTKKHRVITYITIFSLLLSNCGSPLPEINLTPTVSTVTHSEWLTLIPEREKQFENKLAFYILAVKENCFSLGETIPIGLTFENLASYPLTFRASFLVGPSSERGHLNYTIFSEVVSVSSNKILTYGPVFIDEFPQYPNPDEFVQIPPKSGYTAIINFDFPASAESESGYNRVLPGQYVLRFFYVNSFIGPVKSDSPIEFSDIMAWVGEIESNQIEVCIQG